MGRNPFIPINAQKTGMKLEGDKCLGVWKVNKASIFLQAFRCLASENTGE